MKKIIVAVLSLFVAFQGLSAASPDEILNRIEKANSAQSCVTSSFRHTKVLATKAKKTSGLGHVVLAGQQAYHESTGNGMGNPW